MFAKLKERRASETAAGAGPATAVIAAERASVSVSASTRACGGDGDNSIVMNNARDHAGAMASTQDISGTCSSGSISLVSGCQRTDMQPISGGGSGGGGGKEESSLPVEETMSVAQRIAFAAQIAGVSATSSSTDRGRERHVILYRSRA